MSTFSHKQKLKEFVATRPALQEILKLFLRKRENNKGQKFGST